MGKNVLLVVAAGKSSRFGGYPKAFCSIGDGTNLDNTIARARGIFDKVYVGVNPTTYAKYKASGCEMFVIKPGQGDAHSFLKCLRYIREKEPTLQDIYVCWGDAVFVDSVPFNEFIGNADKVAVACANDKNPYAWFDVDTSGAIIADHFAIEGAIAEGMHDQSLFHFDLDFALSYLNEYRESLGIPYDNTEIDKNEMKLLHSFVYLYKKGGECAKCVPITANKVLSFNTVEELEQVKERVGLC